MDSTSNPDTHESCRKVAIKIRMMGASVSYRNSKFVQCLANPTYIPLYPHCLIFLELLQNPSFLNAIAPSSAPPASLPSSVAPAASPTPAPTPVAAAALFR